MDTKRENRKSDVGTGRRRRKSLVATGSAALLAAGLLGVVPASATTPAGAETSSTQAADAHLQSGYPCAPGGAAWCITENGSYSFSSPGQPDLSGAIGGGWLYGNGLGSLYLNGGEAGEESLTGGVVTTDTISLNFALGYNDGGGVLSGAIGLDGNGFSGDIVFPNGQLQISGLHIYWNSQQS